MSFRDLGLDWLQGLLSSSDAPGGDGPGPFESLLPVIEPMLPFPIPKGKPDEDDALETIIDIASDNVPIDLGMGELAKETYKEGKKNVKEYNRRKRDALDAILAEGKK